MPMTSLSLSRVGALALTRAALGVGVGLLAADRLQPRTRHVVGGALLAVGVVSTVPLLVSILQGIGSTNPPTT
jgi:hypothetical protein